MRPDAIATKTANFLVAITSARASPMLGSVLNGYQRHYGGVWVGGRATLTATTLELHANAANRAVQRGELDIVLDLAAVTAVTDLPGVITKIIEVESGEGSVRLRCWGAPAFARQIREAVAAAR